MADFDLAAMPELERRVICGQHIHGWHENMIEAFIVDLNGLQRDAQVNFSTL